VEGIRMWGDSVPGVVASADLYFRKVDLALPS
jgi:hypothetical protein